MTPCFQPASPQLPIPTPLHLVEILLDHTFDVSTIHRTLTWTAGSLTGGRVSRGVGGFAESAQETDSGRNLSQGRRKAWLASTYIYIYKTHVYPSVW